MAGCLCSGVAAAGQVPARACIPAREDAGCGNMITFLRGRLVTSLPDRACLDVGGVGYEVRIPLSTYDRLGETGREVSVLTHFNVREDEQALY